jgi:RNA polymerase sigma-70 factor (ECF subfamily)
LRDATVGDGSEAVVGGIETRTGRVGQDEVEAAAMAGDQAAFAALAERYRRELHVHCYRMLGSVQDAEDMVQETLLRAWRGRERFQGRSSVRTWLYRIATNACLDALAHGSRRVLPHQVAPAAEPRVGDPPGPNQEIVWLQPYPDRLLDAAAPADAEPDAQVVARETIELAFLAAIQLLPPRQRAALILRDVLGWSARETASLLETSLASANSAVQRARVTMRQHLPPRRLDWAPSTEPTAEERAVLQRYMDATEQADIAALAELLAEDARAMMPPAQAWFQGRDAILTMLEWGLGPEFGTWRLLPTRANRQPAAACYLRAHGDSVYRAFAIDVLRVEGGKVAEITAFPADLFPAFGLPATL